MFNIIESLNANQDRCIFLDRLFNPNKNIKFPIDTQKMLPGSSHKIKFIPAHGSHPFSKHFLIGGIASVLSGILIWQLTQDAEYYNDCHTVYSWPETGFEEHTECEQKKKDPPSNIYKYGSYFSLINGAIAIVVSIFLFGDTQKESTATIIY